MKPLIAFLLLLVVTGCASGRVTDDFCLTVQPLRFTQKTIDAMTDDEVADVLKHNEFGAKRCGWMP